MNAIRPPDDDDARPAFAPSSIQPDVDLDASSPLVAGNKLAVGLRLDEYEISGVLGEGGFGIVYLAWDHSLQRRLAIKEYFPASLAWRARGTQVQVKSERHAESFDAGLRSFINEAKLLASFDHPSLVKVHRFWQANGTAYMVMPFYEGITLKQALTSSDKAPDERWLRDLLQPLLAALEYMHDASCYHRDIAPDNVLLVDEGRPLLLDFGAARRVIGDMTKAVTVILKPGYAPIEQYGDMPGIGQGPWTDIYALGAVLHFAITGTVPRASVTRLVADDYQPLAERCAGRYSDKLLRGVDRMLVVRPEGRPQTIGELRRLIDIEVSQDSGRIVLPSRVAPDAEPWTRPITRSQPAPLANQLPEKPPEKLPEKLPMPAVSRPRFRPTWGLLALASVALLLLLIGLWRFTATSRDEAVVSDPPATEPAAVPAAEPAPVPQIVPASSATEPAASAPARAASVQAPAASESAPAASVQAPVASAPTPKPPVAASAAPGPVIDRPAPGAPAASASALPPAPRLPQSPASTAAVVPAKPLPTAAASKPVARPPVVAVPRLPKRVEPAASATPTTSPRIPSNARCADIIQRVSIGEALTASDRRILQEECGK
ncbi:serine/threonine protein kinase [Aquabacterium sp.]|uniref:serine/threonine protein kinase n=1 Tax=Aquabacterium sp. TaxID=1872578 RepID=UPI002CC91DD3|nr:protein kinase [Aquabacterium sp.]HSW05380.1 protein kinase [Aquabacterium sp.]